MTIDYVALGSALIGSIIWFARLEGRIKNNEMCADSIEKQLDLLRVKHEALDNRVLEELSRVRESLARIEGSLQVPIKKERK